MPKRRRGGTLHSPVKRLKEADRKQTSRNVESSQRRSQRLAVDAAQHSQHRENETQAERQERLTADAAQHRQKRNVEYLNTARHRHPIIPPFYSGPMTTICPHCRSLRFRNEPLNCCHNGKVDIPPLSQYPVALHQLLTVRSPQATNFNENIRQYNSAFAFASMGAQIAQPRGRGPYCFRIHGQIYHRSGTLHPPQDTSHRFGQIYILEGHQAVQSRLQAPENQNCREDVMSKITEVMEEVSPFAAA